jgi:hypothetical protein
MIQLGERFSNAKPRQSIVHLVKGQSSSITLAALPSPGILAKPIIYMLGIVDSLDAVVDGLYTMGSPFLGRMSRMNILTVNLVLSTVVFWLAAHLYLLPRLGELTPQTILTPILLLHGLRHLGLMFLATGAIYPGMPAQFAYPAAYGDLLAAALAIASLLALMRNLRVSRLLVWIFNIEGTIDLITAITLATIYGAADFMGPAYWIPAFWVPTLLVTHAVTFLVLIKYWPAATVR